MITLASGSIFDDPRAAILVNPVNVQGVAGAGLALCYKRRYPMFFAPYREACFSGELRVGTVWMYEPARILCVPTKVKFSNPSTLDIVRTSLDAMVRWMQWRAPTSIAIPALGCGCGGLSWLQVQPIIEEKLAGFDAWDIRLFPPQKN